MIAKLLGWSGSGMGFVVIIFVHNTSVNGGTRKGNKMIVTFIICGLIVCVLLFIGIMIIDHHTKLSTTPRNMSIPEMPKEWADCDHTDLDFEWERSSVWEEMYFRVCKKCGMRTM